MTANQIRPRPSSLEESIRDPKYLAFLRTQPCVVPGCWRSDIEAMHTGTKGASTGVKACDLDAVPGCSFHHRTGPRPKSHHSTAEWMWEAHHGISLGDERVRLLGLYREVAA